MLSHLLFWLDASPVRYAAAAWLTFAGAVVLAGAGTDAGARRAWWRHPAWFAGAMLLALLAFRWPILLHNQQLADPDESQMLAGALTLRYDPRFWESVDGTTHGPITQWLLLGAHRLGAPLDYTTARTVTVLLCWTTLLAAWAILRHLFGERRGRLYVLPLLAWYAFMRDWYFVAYCSEHSPEALLALGVAGLLTAWDRDGRELRTGRLFLGGLALGAVPFAKLQAVPSALFAGLAGIALVLGTTTVSWRARGRAALVLMGGGVVFPATMLLWIVARGIWGEFWSSYVRNNLQYAGARWFPWSETPWKFTELVIITPEYHAAFWWLGGAALMGLLGWPRFTPWQRRCVLFAGGLFAAAVFATMSPGKQFQHYLQLAIFATALFAGIAGGSLLASLPARPAGPVPLGGARAMALVLWLALTLGPQIRWRARENQPHDGAFRRERGQLIRSPVAEEILRHARPGERLGIWGWMPNFWIETGMPQATRDGNNARQITPAPDRDDYRRRYMRDLEANRPPVFVDVVGGDNFNYKDRATAGHETFPALRDYIAAHYRLVRDLEGSRIYVAHERL